MICFDGGGVVFAVDVANLAVQSALLVGFLGYRVDIRPVELSHLRRRVAGHNRHAKNAGTAGDVENLEPFSFNADLEHVAKRLRGRLCNNDDTEHQLLPDLELGAAVHATPLSAGFQRLLDMRYAVPDR